MSTHLPNLVVELNERFAYWVLTRNIYGCLAELSNAAVAGYVSFQNPNTGSWFVQALCSELEANWQRLEMIQMLTRVCRVLAYSYSSYTPSNRATHNLKQVSSVTTTLTKAIRFHQPWSECVLEYFIKYFMHGHRSNSWLADLTCLILLWH